MSQMPELLFDSLIMNGSVPDTPFQRWLGQKGACTTARLKVAGKTAQEVWATWRSLDEMRWMLFALDGTFQHDYYYEIARRLTMMCQVPDSMRQLVPQLPHSFLDMLNQPPYLIPTTPEVVVAPKRKIFHLVMASQTITFFDEETRTQWAGFITGPCIIPCESEITEEEFQRLRNLESTP